MGRTAGVLIRAILELRAVLDAKPFRKPDPASVGVIFLPKLPPVRLLTLRWGAEDLRMIGRSRLKLPFAAGGTTRNLNMTAKIVAMAGA